VQLKRKEQKRKEKKRKEKKRMFQKLKPYSPSGKKNWVGCDIYSLGP
jgi:hypothetical protein